MALSGGGMSGVLEIGKKSVSVKSRVPRFQSLGREREEEDVAGV